jgi:hypothetical protein
MMPIAADILVDRAAAIAYKRRDKRHEELTRVLVYDVKNRLNRGRRLLGRAGAQRWQRDQTRY